VDSVGSANGSLQGGAAIENGQLVLTGNSGCCANLPASLLFGDTATTIEAWASFGSLPANCYLFAFGNTDSSGNGEDYLFCAPQEAYISISDTDPGNQAGQNAYCSSWSGETNLHIVAVFNPPLHSLSIYTNGYLAATNSAETYSLLTVNDAHSYIGRSLYTADPYAPLSVQEFRIYRGALSPQQIAIDAATGPSQINTSLGMLQSISLVVSNPMPAGATQQVLALANFTTVSNVNLWTYGSPVVASTNTSVLGVSSTGMITAYAPGTDTVTLAYGGLTATQTVVVSGFATNQFTYNSFGDGFWSIVNAGNSNAFVPNGNYATQEPYTNGATEQQFQVLYNLPNATFRLRQRSTWHCAAAATPASGAAVPVTAFYEALTSQEWRLVNAGGGYYRIFNAAATNLVLQTDNASPAHVSLAAPSGSTDQLWQFAYQTHFPKKGTAGYEGSPYQTELTTSWAYNYDDNTSATEAASFDYVPMVYDATYWEPLGDAQSRDAVWLASAQPAYLLCCNEPDNASQANLSTNAVIGLWPAFEALGVPLVGPGTQNTEDAWENNFYSLIAANHYRVDYAAVHEYVPPNSGSLISDLESVYNAYGHPVWLTEFSPVDWSGCKCWSEDDNYNFLAEFMWQAENTSWLMRYAVFPFSNSNSDSPWVDDGFTGSIFLSDGQTLSPYGELYATWDGVETPQTRVAYIIHNLATSFRLTDTNTSATPLASDIYMRNATTEWALLPAPESGHFYIISLNDGRRVRNDGGKLDLAPLGTTNAACDWWLNGPNSSGYYYIDNLAASQSIQGYGAAPAISFGMVNDPAPSTATQWRLVKAYKPVTIVTPTPPLVTIGYASQGATLAWTGNGSFYNIYRSTVSGGPYTPVASDIGLTNYVDGALQNGTTYYYVVTSLNILGEESAYSAQVIARPASTVIPSVAANTLNNGGQNGLQINWPADHTGWRLLMNTNGLANPNWIYLPNSDMTNQVWLPVGPYQNVFFELVYP